MKVSMNLLLWATHVTADHFPLLGKLRSAGYEGVEIPCFEGDESHFKMLRGEFDRQGLHCTTVTVLGPDANPVSPDPSIRKAALERVRWAIRMSAALGSEILCGPYHSPLGVFTGVGPTADERNWCADVLRQAAADAQAAGVKLAIEYLNRFECYFLTTAAETKDFVRRVGHPNFKMMFDTFHANIEEKSIGRALADVVDQVIHIHVSENDRGTPGTGHIAWPETFRALRRGGYDGWLAIEAFGRALPALAAATRVWRDLFPNPEDVYTNGLRFVKRMWEEAA